MVLDIEPSDYDFAIFMRLAHLHLVCLLSTANNLQQSLLSLCRLEEVWSMLPFLCPLENLLLSKA